MSIATAALLALLQSGDGFTGSYWTGSTDFKGEPALVRVDPEINFNWGLDQPAPEIAEDGFCVRWTGMLTPPYPGTYTFIARTDDGVRLWVNDQLIIDHWHPKQEDDLQGTLDLREGVPVKIVMEFFDVTKHAVAKLFWKSPEIDRKILPREYVTSSEFALPRERSSDKTAPVPDPATQASIRKEIHKIFEEDYNSRDASKKHALGKKLLNAVGETRDDTDTQFVLLCEVRDIAASTGDHNTAFKAIHLLDRLFSLAEASPSMSGDKMKLDVLETLRRSAKTRGDYTTLARAYLSIAESTLHNNAFADASTAVQKAASLARTSGNRGLLEQATNLMKEIPNRRRMHGEYLKAEGTLLQNPDDPDANLAVGLHLCFVKRDWKKGLPLLAKGRNEKLKEAAAADLAAPDTPKAMSNVAESWRELSERERDTTARGHYRYRALYWYRRAKPKAEGLLRTMIEMRIKDLSGKR